MLNKRIKKNPHFEIMQERIKICSSFCDYDIKEKPYYWIEDFILANTIYRKEFNNHIKYNEK